MKTQNKLSYIIIGTIFLIVGIYTAIWYTQAELIKSNVFKLIEKTKEELGAQNNIEFVYKEISYSGFPFSLHVAIKEPRLSLTEKNNNAFIISSPGEDIVIKAHPFRPKHYDLARPKIIVIEHIPHNGPSTLVSINTKSNANDFVINADGIVDAIKSKNENIEVAFSDKFLLKIKNFNTDSVTDWSITNKKKQKTKVEIDDVTIILPEKEGDTSYSKKLQALLKKIQPINIKSDSTITEPYPMEAKNQGMVMHDMDIEVKDFSFLNNMFGLHIEGECHGEASDLLPHATLKLTIQKLEGFLEFQREIMHILSEEEKEKGRKEISIFEDVNIDKMRHFLRDIADENVKDSENITISFSREKGKQFKIGNHTLPEVMILFQNIYGEKEKKSYGLPLESKQEESSENMKELQNPTMLFPGEML